MFEDWLEKIYDYDRTKVASTLDDVMNTVDDIAYEDLNFNLVQNIFDEARRIGGEDIPSGLNISQSERLNKLFEEIDCNRMDLQMLSGFCTIANMYSNRISTYDAFVERLKAAKGSEPRFQNIFRGFRGFEE